MILPYNPTITLEKCNKEFKKLKPLKYNRFMWWRMYSYKTQPLSKPSALVDKILNGDFEPSCYKTQAQWCEHELNREYKECYPDQSKFLERTTTLRNRRKRLIDDFERDETERLENVQREFRRYFGLTQEQLDENIEKCKGKIIDLYYTLKEKQMKNETKVFKYFKTV
jgi:hypothetical protein